MLVGTLRCRVLRRHGAGLSPMHMMGVRRLRNAAAAFLEIIWPVPQKCVRRLT